MKKFNGEIEGKKLSDFSLDKLVNVKTLAERMDKVEELMYNEGHVHNFFTTYFNEYYNVSPNQTGYLSEETSISRMLEIVGTYLLSSSDVESERKIEYRFWKSERDFKKSMESENVNTSSLQKSMVDDRVEVIDMFVDRKNDKNQKIVKDISVQAKDIADIVEIRRIEDAISYLKSESGILNIKNKIAKALEEVTREEDVARLKYILNNTERYVKRYVTDLRENQVAIKKAIKRPIEFKNTLKDEGADTDWFDIINFENDKCVKVLLEHLYQKDLSGSEFGLILWDLYEFITKKLKLSKREREVIDLFSKGYKQVDIVNELGTNKQNVNTYVSRIVKKIQDSGYDIE
ncbi:LuxR C-terminal-related transcriptional regulator [Bacillus paranthracis]|uniref:LuxR C-terminal-related transcriptional regulator n=1 Tax=Bacillus paranthracis TaxID=2026186 RepID=UPI002D777F60|nr:LuxR C-terminal-related transcriptional regulator [Bacillus paranthracis]